MKKRGMICGCDSSDTFQMPITSRVFVPCRPFMESLVTPTPAWFAFPGGEKNGLRSMRQDSPIILRPQAAPSARSILRRLADLCAIRGSARAVPELRQGEAGTTVMVGRQSLLHQTLRFLCRSTLPVFDHTRCRQGTASGLEDCQRACSQWHDGTSDYTVFGRG